MSLASTQDIFWAAGLSAHLILLFVLWNKDRAKNYPFFTALIIVNILNALVLKEIWLHCSRDIYRVAYFGFAILDFVLQLCITFELASQVFASTGKWAPDVRRGFSAVAVLSVMVAGLLSTMPTPPETTLLKSVLDRSNLFSSALLCELLLGMIAFSVTARLPWKTHVARIAQGFGFYALIGILTETGHSAIGSGTSLSMALTLVRMTSYLFCTLFWIITLWRDAPAPRELPPELREQLFALQRIVAYDLQKFRALKK